MGKGSSGVVVFLAPMVLMGVSLLLGLWAQRHLGAPQPVATRLTRLCLTSLEPFALLLAFWEQRVVGTNLVYLPLLGALIALAGGTAGWGLAGFWRANRKDCGTLVLMGAFSNIGMTFGAFLCFVLMGESGFGKAIAFNFYFSFLFFTAGFAIARWAGRASHGPAESFLRQTLRDPANMMPLGAVLVGVGLNVASISRPAPMGTVMKVLVPITLSIYLFAIGLSFRPAQSAKYLWTCASMGGIKFLFAPAVGLALGTAFLRFFGGDGEVLRVIFIESCMPVAIMSVVLTQLFDLNRDMASTCWISTNGAAILLSPLILWLATML